MEDNEINNINTGKNKSSNKRIEKRIQEMKKQKRKQEVIRKYFLPFLILIILFFLFIIIIFVKNHDKKRTNIEYKVENDEEIQSETNIEIVDEEEITSVSNEIQEVNIFQPIMDSSTKGFSSDIISQYGILMDVKEQKVLAQKDAYVKMYPASMTKILTVLVAAEHIKEDQLGDKFTITREITDYSFSNDCSCVGFDVDESVTIEDLFYGTVLPSGADAALGLAYYIAGSHEKFVDMMNEKLQELGISETTHFTNCVGIYNDEHYSTAYDMALIMKAAYDNEMCRKYLSAHTYTTSSTEQHPEGITISNWFLRRIEDKDTHGEVMCGKTGYVRQSGNCAASLAIDKNGKEYICVTAMSSSVWKCINDQTTLYASYMQELGNCETSSQS